MKSRQTVCRHRLIPGCRCWSSLYFYCAAVSSGALWGKGCSRPAWLHSSLLMAWPESQERPCQCCRAWNPPRGLLGAALASLPLAQLENVNPCRHRGAVKAAQRSALARYKFQLFGLCKVLFGANNSKCTVTRNHGNPAGTWEDSGGTMKWHW